MKSRYTIDTMPVKRLILTEQYMQLTWLVLTILLIWLSCITYFYLKLSNHYNNLLKGVNQHSLHAVLEKVMNDFDVAKKDIALLRESCDRMEKEGLLHIQKVGLLRFNPFKDTGGDQSFILALVDGENTGVLVSGLYSRSGTRWYAKKVLHGNPVDHEFSTEEKQALKEATQIKGKP